MQAATQSDKVQDIQTLQEYIGVEACKVLPFVNALTECDTNSSFFGKTKSSAFKSIIKSPVLYK